MICVIISPVIIIIQYKIFHVKEILAIVFLNIVKFYIVGYSYHYLISSDIISLALHKFFVGTETLLIVIATLVNRIRGKFR